MDEERLYPKRPLVGVAGIVLDNNRDDVLLVVRGNEPGKGIWSFPGGLVRLGEKVRDAVKREVEEETGIIVKTGDIAEIFDVIVPDEKGRLKFHYVVIDFLAEKVGGILAPSGDAFDAKWVPIQSIDEYNIHKAAKDLLKRLFPEKFGKNIAEME